MQAPPASAFQGNQAQGSGSLQSRRSGGDPPLITPRAPSGRPKKRERNEAVCEPVKHPRIDKSRSCADERDGSQKPEAPSLVGKDGGLCSVASVDRLVCIMTYEWNDSMQRPVDLTLSRTMLAKVVAATVELDCLFRFLKLGGLNVLNRWLQEVYMGRSSTEKEASADGDRAVEDLLLALLGALERLPVDLNTLKTCCIGKSVNYLRSHKHPDIQRRARKLVETWKRRVESEMQSGEARFSSEQSVCPQQPDPGMSASNAQQESHPEHPAPKDYSGVGRGKYASVASLCSSPESQSKGSSTIIPQACSVDTCNKSPLSPLKPSNEGLRLAVESALHPSNAFPQSSECGRVTTSSACVQGPCNNQIRAARNTGSSRHSKNTNLSVSNTSSAATALSGSVFVPKDQLEQGIVYDRSPQGVNLFSAAEACTLPCCSFFQKSSDHAVVYDPPSRSTLNSASSCVADCKEKPLHPTKCNLMPICSEPIKAGIQMLASIAASESSTIDVKSPDSPSVKSMCLQRATTRPMESKIPAETIMKIHNYQPSKTGGSPQEREHYDRNSSTVSSPSEQSTHMDASIYEDKRATAVYEDTPSPADTASETSLPSALVSKDAGRKRGDRISSARKEHGTLQLSFEKSKRPCLQSTSVAEAVGESSIVDNIGCENRAKSTQKTTFGNATAKKVSTERSPSSRCNEDDALEASRPGAVKVEQEVANCKGISFRGANFDRNSSVRGDAMVAIGPADAFAMVGSKQESPESASPLRNVPFPVTNGNAKDSLLGAHAGSAGSNTNAFEQKQGSEAPANTAMENKRLEFDLNEMFSSGEEGPVQVSGPFSKSWGPMQGFLVPASDGTTGSPAVPMAPIAVVAAAKGPFMLQAISCWRPPTGELGWKGSAATSAFRPTQPRSSLPKSNLNVPEQRIHGKAVLDFDLNIAADSSSFVDDKIGNADVGVKSSSVDVKMAALQAAGGANFSSAMSRKTCEPARAGWDLNEVDEGAVESGTKLDFDLNNGPNVQDYDDIVLAAKHIRLKDPAASNRLPSHPITPILMPAFALPNTDIPYAAGNAMPWVNGGPHDGLLQYNIFMQNPSGFASSAMACPPLPSMGAGPLQGMPFRFSSTSMQGFSTTFGDSLGAPQAAAVYPSTEPLVPSHSKPPYIMGMLADVVHQQGMGGFWNRPKFDLNAGPEGIDGSNAKDDRRHMFVMNEQMRVRHQVGDKAAVLHQREQEGCVGMQESMQGVPMKQSMWR